jgi:hypothetical protein
MKRVRGKELQPRTVEYLKAVISSVWEDLDQNMLDELVLGFTRRAVMGVKANDAPMARAQSPVSDHEEAPYNPEDFFGDTWNPFRME